MIESLLNKGQTVNIGREISNIRRTETAQNSKLSNAQNQLIDQVNISENATQRLADLQNLDRQLTRFLDVLKGNRSADSVIAELDAERVGGGVSVSGIESRSVLTTDQITFIEETTTLSAEINEEGELDLILSNVRETLSQNNFSLSTQQNSFTALLS